MRIQESPPSTHHRDQRPSHSSLIENTCSTPDPSDRIDAIIVPASRPPSALSGAAHLAVRLHVLLVTLCSKRARATDVAAFLDPWADLRTLIAEVPPGYQHGFLPDSTAAIRFGEASGGRISDLATKRNLGLLIARLMGWGKILFLFLDDDIGDQTGTGPAIAPTIPTASHAVTQVASCSRSRSRRACSDSPVSAA